MDIVSRVFSAWNQLIGPGTRGDCRSYAPSLSGSMTNHFSPIGFSVDSLESLGQLVDQLRPHAEPRPSNQGVYWVWTASSGAQLVIQEGLAGEVVGITPCFEGESRNTVRVEDIVRRQSDSPLEGAFAGWLSPSVDDPFDGACQICFDVCDFYKHSSFFGYQSLRLEVQFSAFPEEITLYPNRESFESEDSGDCSLSSQGLVPLGLLGFDGSPKGEPSAQVLLNGHILKTEKRTNPFSGETFYWVLLESFGGYFDVLIDPQSCDAVPVVGGVVSGTFWVVGRVLSMEAPQPIETFAKKSFWRHLLFWS